MCTEEPPAIPHDDEYNESMEKDDGRVSIEHYVYPGLTSPYTGLHISTLNQSEIPRNYMANLTYEKSFDFKIYLIFLDMNVDQHESSKHRMVICTTRTP